MKASSRILPFATLTALLLAPVNLPAKSLLLDFGPTATQAAYATNSPAHFVGAVSASEIAWNTITADQATLVYSDASAATGVSVDLGRSTAGSDTINFSDNGFTVNALGTTLNGGVYAGSSPVRDGIFGGSGGGNNLALGMRVNGLPSGRYTLYVHGRNSNTALPAPLRFYATNGPSAGTYSFTTNDATAFLANTAPAITNGFVSGDNFGVLTVDLAEGDALYVACEGTIAAEMRGFFNAITLFFGVPQLPAVITAQPAGKTVYEGVTVTLTPGVSGSLPVTNQWFFNDTNLLTDTAKITGATSDQLTLHQVTPEMAGNYRVSVANALASDLSSNATLKVVPPLNTAQMTNIWSLLPGQRPYLGTGGTERSLAYNPVTGNLLLVSRLPADPAIVVLDAKTGAEKHFMDVSGIPQSQANVSLGLNAITVADDGIVFAGNVTANANTTPFLIYGWPDDSTSYQPSIVFTGDPGAGVAPGLRWGDSMAVRGSGPNTQFLLAPASGTNVVLLRTLSGYNFLNEVPPKVIAVSGVGSGFARFSIDFGPGTNTFWAKTSGGSLVLVEFDAEAGTGQVVQNYSTVVVPTAVRAVAVDPSQKFLAGVMGEPLGQTVRLYDVSDFSIGAAMRDQEVFATQNAASIGTAALAFGTNVLFALDENNGIKAFVINKDYVPPVISIAAQPADRTAMEGATVSFTSLAVGNEPLFLQWRHNGTNILVDGPNISGANSGSLMLRNISQASAGTYSMFASNVFGTATSSNALLTVVPTFNTAQMTNIWNLLPLDRPYLGTNSNERGLAYNPATASLLLVSRANPDPSVIVLDAATGAEKHTLNTAGIPATVPGTSLGLSTIDVADDGAVFGASVTVNAATTGFALYRWANDSATTAPVAVFSGDPAENVEPGIRWTDAIAVRGAGAETQVLLAPGSGTNVALLRSSTGLDFKNEVPPAILSISGVPSGFARLGIAFGPGTNTFWAKSPDAPLYLVQFDLNSKTGTVLREYGTNLVPASLRGIGSDASQNFLAGIAFDLSHTVRLYDVSNLDAGPVLRDQEVFTTTYVNNVSGGTGAITFGGSYLFALDTNNGLKAFLIDPNYVPPVTSFAITGVRRTGDSIILTWQSNSGQTYQVQSRESLSSGAWSNLGTPISATEASTSFTNSISGASLFYRVLTQ